MSAPPTIMLQPTTRIVEVNGVPARVWEGVTPDMQHVVALIAQIAVHKDADQAAFQASLQEAQGPTKAAVEIYPLRMLI
jgi:hypothetical protein